MLRLLKLYILINLHYSLIECLIPGSQPELRVRTLDEKLIERKRQDTMDMCRIFTEETEKLEKLNEIGMKNSMRGNRRVKRQLNSNSLNSMSYVDDARRVESIVDQMYDDLSQKGEKINYRRMDVQAPERNKTIQKSMSGRRFDFAPQLFLGPGTPPRKPNELPPATGKTPRFKLGIVPYFIDRKTYDSPLAQRITNSFDEFERATCIRMQRLRERPTDRESLQNIEWVYITNPTGIRQCVHSNDRPMIKGVQMVVLGYDCMSHGDIIHEIMHILGFSHEHTRPDRDQYISIMWDNIKPGYKKYFERIDTPNVENLPYDYASILHYPSRAFSKNGQMTILTQRGVKIGQRDGLSEMDIEKISSLYSSECVKRNRQYLLQTCPSVVKAKPDPPKATKEEINDYFESRLWPYAIVNYKYKDAMEFTNEERENIQAVITHIETETCLEFRDLTKADKESHSESSSSEEKSGSNNDNKNRGGGDKSNGDNKNNSDNDNTNKTEVVVYSDFDENSLNGKPGHTTLATNSDDIPNQKPEMARLIIKNVTSLHGKEKHLKLKRELLRKLNKRGKHNKRGSPPVSPARRHAANILVLTRSPQPGCACPETPGVPGDPSTIELSVECFNSVNLLLHFFVHLLGLDHQHNSHDRDSYLHIVWDQLTDDVKEDMKQKLPPAASVGFPYDYQSVMHYPWLRIKNGRTNIMYPIWNDGWAMGSWQGLSSVDVQKLNKLYSKQCALRRKEASHAIRNSQQ